MPEAKNIYLLGICGTGVGALAGMLERLGHHVRGSDENVYPPMSDKLAEWGIPIDKGYDPAFLKDHPDLVVVGNVIRAVNPQAVYTREAGLPFMSMPQAVAEFGIRDKHCIVVAGTHGKTSGTSLAAHVLVDAGRDPSFLVGGALLNHPESFRVGDGGVFVIEGDEYDTAYFDKGPKFLHYRPRTAIITSLEFDHADIFGDISDIERAFADFIELVPADGHLVVWEGATRARRLLAERARAERVTIYGVEPGQSVDLCMRRWQSGPAGLTFEAEWHGESLGTMQVPLWGEFSAQNVLAVVAALRGVDVSPEEIRAGLASYRGVKRRMEVRGEPDGVIVVDDFAHHPTAVRQTLQAARTRWPDRKLWALFEPRSATSRRNIFDQEYLDAFEGADEVILGSHVRLAEVPEDERFDPVALAAALTERGTRGRAIAVVDDLAATLVDEVRSGDVVMVMSNGDFGGLHRLLLDGFANRGSAA